MCVVAWDTETTRRRLQEAATAEFAERGPDGTTMARIATRAGINKERLYKYFGDKDALFETVLSDELAKLAESVAPYRDEDVGEFAGRTFDYHAAHPELARLLIWEGLTGRAPADEAARTAHYRDKVRRVSSAGLDPDHFVFFLIGLSAWWIAAPQLAFMLSGADADDPDERARRRGFVVEAARRLATRT